MDLLEVLNWRYAVKKYNKDLVVSNEKLQEIIQAISLSASSTGLQPYRVFLINNSEIKQELAKSSFNSQIAEAPHLLVFAAFDSISKEQIGAMIRLMATERNISEEQLTDYKNALEATLLTRSNEENFNWSAKQAYIALGTAMIAAANLHIDATPMEGFDPAKLDELLQLKEKGLKSVLLLSLGYRDEENDFLAKQKKVRLPIEEFVTEIH